MRSLIVAVLLGLPLLVFSQTPTFVELEQLINDTSGVAVIISVPWGNLDVPNLFVTVPLVQSDTLPSLELRALYYSNVQLDCIKEQFSQGVIYLRNWWRLGSAQTITLSPDFYYTMRVPLIEPVNRRAMVSHIDALYNERALAWQDSHAVMLKRR